MGRSYVIVTPVKNEEEYLPKTARSVINQSIKPDKWLIIDDGSSDATGKIIEELSARYKWIRGIANTEDTAALGRRIGGQAVIHLGLESIDPTHYDFIVRMDADVTFAADFFGKLFEEFALNDRLGIASGVCYVMENGKLVEEKNPRFHTRGPLKVYRSSCYQAIGGLDREEGWDTIDEIKANMKGWRTRNFPDFKVTHLRKTQSAGGVLNGFKNKGITAYYTGYHPIFLLFRSLKNMTDRPYIIGGLYMLIYYLQGYIKQLPKVNDAELINFMREQQINKLLGKKTIWQ